LCGAIGDAAARNRVFVFQRTPVGLSPAGFILDFVFRSLWKDCRTDSIVASPLGRTVGEGVGVDSMKPSSELSAGALIDGVGVSIV
jgi:hypothetical protein